MDAGGENTQANALLFLLIGTVGIIGVFKMCYPFNRLRTFLFVTTGIGFYAMVAICLYLKDHILAQDILKMAIPENQTCFIFLLFAAMGIAVERILALTICREKTKIKNV